MFLTTTLCLGSSIATQSALVPALAKECNLPLITCRGPEILDRYIGASEAKVRELFARAADVAPSILFLDELDALAPRRGSDHTGVTDRGKRMFLVTVIAFGFVLTTFPFCFLAFSCKPAIDVS